VEQLLTLIAYFTTFSPKQLAEDNSAAHILSQLTSYHVLLMLHYLADALGGLNRLSVLFQHHNIDLSDVTHQIDLFLERMARCYGTMVGGVINWGKGSAREYGGTFLRRFVTRTQAEAAEAAEAASPEGVAIEAEAEAHAAAAGDNQGDAEVAVGEAEAAAAANNQDREALFGGNKITVDDNSVQTILRTIGEFSQQIHSRVTERFPSNKILAALEILNPASLETDDLNSYGEESLAMLIEAFGTVRELRDPDDDSIIEVVKPLVDGDALRYEFEDLKEELLDAKKRGISIHRFWKLKGTRTDANVMPNLKMLAAIRLLLFLASACCETGFSVQNRIKDKFRNRLSIELLDALMRCSLLGPDMEQKELVVQLVDEALTLWEGQACRNPLKGNPGMNRVRRKMHRSSKPRVLETLLYEHLGDPVDLEVVNGHDGAMAEEDSDDDSSDALNDNQTVSATASLLGAVGPYQGETGWELVHDPPVADKAGSSKPKLSKIKGKNIAHCFLRGWLPGKVRGLITGKKDNGKFNVYYSDDGRLWAQELSLEDYGVDKAWVLIKRAKKA
jgi:hypothetical protein